LRYRRQRNGILMRIGENCLAAPASTMTAKCNTALNPGCGVATIADVGSAVFFGEPEFRTGGSVETFDHDIRRASP
jgi:hypothetical protein